VTEEEYITMALEFVRCSNGDEKPKEPYKALRAPDEFNSVVCHWDDKEDGTWGRASCDMYCEGLQAWFPWGGDEYDSQSLDSFQVLVKHRDYRYSWIHLSRVNDRPDKFQPLDINGYSPAVIDGRLGKMRMDTSMGWTSWNGSEVVHEDVDNAIILCAREKDSPGCPGQFRRVEHGDSLPDDALQSDDREGSYVCMWDENEDGTFGRIRLNDGEMEAWFPWGGEEYASNSISGFQVLCKDEDFKYKWKAVHKIKKKPRKYEVFQVNGYSPAVVDGLLGKLSLDKEMAWNSWAGEEINFTDDDFENALVLCYKEREDD